MPPPSPLQLLEAQILELQTALVASDPARVEQHAQSVRRSMAALADWLTQTPAGELPPDTRQRALALGAQLSSTRDQLARVLAITSQQAASLLPPVETVTYGSAASNKARIYRAPG